MSLSRPLKEDSWVLPLSTPLSSRRSMVCGFVPAASVSSSSTLQIFWDRLGWILNFDICMSVWVSSSPSSSSSSFVSLLHLPPFLVVVVVVVVIVVVGAGSLKLWGRWHVLSDCHHLRQSIGEHARLLPPSSSFISSWQHQTSEIKDSKPSSVVIPRLYRCMLF